MNLRLTCHQTTDDRLLVFTEVSSRSPSARSPRSCCRTTLFDHEDVFLRLVIVAELDEVATRELIANVILTVSQPARAKSWLDLEVSPEQFVAMGLDESTQARSHIASSPFGENMAQFHDFLMQAPTPFVLLTGPEHRFSFVNQPYMEMISRTCTEDVLGKPIREALPELEERPFFHLLDEVFRTQVPHVGVEVPARIRYPYDNSYEDRHYDFIYHPVIGPDGTTSGIMVQTSDVTERVLARAVSDGREQQLFRQWVELDTIYRTSPAAMALFSAADLKILRINDRQAEWMGGKADELVGKRITSLPFHNPSYVALLRRVSNGETVLDYPFRDTFCAEVVPERMWRISLSPFYNTSGEMEAITSIAVEQFSRLEDPLDYVRTQTKPVL
jgi:PAS domain-containing protein